MSAELRLVSYRLDPSDGSRPDEIVGYELRHTRTGRDGTTLRLPVQVVRKPAIGRVEVSISMEPICCEDQEAGLDKLADWLARAAEAIRTRGVARAGAPTYAGGTGDDEE